jgi:CubicO group peptidase (beta-lactamase class C family)
MWQDPHYADGAYAIIGRALESLVGMSYEDYVHQHIFKPLGTPDRAPHPVLLRGLTLPAHT